MDGTAEYRVDCAFCGERFRERPLFRAHILHCRQHPLCRMADECDALRAALRRILEQLDDDGRPDPRLLRDARSLLRRGVPEAI
jgi:hypothetical protein